MANNPKNSDYLQQVSEEETAVLMEEARKVLQSGISGDMVEFGCYRGDTSLLLERMLEREFANAEAKLWIYDSFEGLPPRTKEDASVAGDEFRAGELLVTKREVVERFKKAGLRVPRVRKGFFEELDDSEESNDLPAEIAYAFLDGDLYQSIKTSLKLVSPRMNKAGVILVHDYNNPKLPGVAQAVEEWMVDYSRTQKTAPLLQRRESLAIIKLS